MLTAAANRLARSAPLRHLLFIAAALAAIWAVGYRFGTFDHAFHIPFLKKTVYPALYPGDPFLELRFYHYSYFWLFFKPLLRLGVLEPAMFAVHVFATYLTFWTLWELSLTLFGNPLAALITLLAFIFPHVGMPGFPLIEDTLLNRTFVLPLLLWAMLLHLRAHHLPAFLVLGLAFNLHALSACFVLAMLGLDCLLRWKEVGWMRILVGALLFAAGALPVLFWKTHHSSIDLTLRPDLLSITARGALASIYYAISSQPILLFGTLCGAGTLGLLLAGLRERASVHDRSVMHFAWAIGLALVVQAISTYWLPVTILLQLQLLRIAFYLLILSYLYFGGVLARAFQDVSLDLAGGDVQLLTFVLVTPPFAPWLMWGLRGWLARRRWRQLAAGTLVAGAMLGAALFGWRSALWQPGYHIYGPQTPWVAAQVWARDHTPVDATFITPPQMYSQYVPDWRVFSERAAVVTLDQLEDIPFDPASLSEWQRRFEALAPGAIARFDYNYVTSERYTAEAFYGLTADELLQVARRYGASYLVLEKPHAQPFPIAYENAGFVIYDLCAVTAP